MGLRGIPQNELSRRVLIRVLWIPICNTLAFSFMQAMLLWRLTFFSSFFLF